MSKKFFTNIEVNGNTIYHRFIENGERKQEKVDNFQPIIFLPTQKDSEFSNLWGHPVSEMRFDGIRNARDYIKQMGGVDGSQINGTTDWALQFASNQYYNDIEYDTSKIRKFYVDIECIQPPEKFGKNHMIKVRKK